MTREKAKELLPIIQAFAEGKIIQVWANDTWQDEESPLFWAYAQFRIKPEQKSEPKYRPFKNQEECWNEMRKHLDFGWVISKFSNIIYHINVISDDHICVDETSLTYSEIFENYIFTDGEPFGIKEEQLKKKCG